MESQCGEVEWQEAFGLEGPAGYKLSSTDWAFDWAQRKMKKRMGAQNAVESRERTAVSESVCRAVSLEHAGVGWEPS